MITVLKKLPSSVTVATSGGCDSMALLNFLSRKHEVKCAFFNHGTDYSKECQEFLMTYCKKYDIPFYYSSLYEEKPKDQSLEEFWRNARYKFLHSFPGTVVTAHHLEDCMEQYIFSSLHGNGRIIPYSNKNVERPLLTTSKVVLKSWCERKNVPWIEDPSNQDTKFMRNFIRHNLMPLALNVNPGLAKVVKKKVISENTKMMKNG